MKDQIFAVGYRRLPTDRKRHWAPWPIARTALALAWRKRITKLAFALCMMSVFGHGIGLGVQLLADRMMQEVEGPRAMMMDATVRGLVGDVHSTLALFISNQMMVVALLLAIVGAGLIAEDRRTGAMELYFSRPLTRRDYVMGKLMAAGLVPLGLYVAPFVVLWLFAMGTAPPDAAGSMWGLLIPGLTGTLLASVLLACTILGVSALGERARTVGVVYFVSIIILTSLGDELPEGGYHWAGYLSPHRNVQTIVDAVMGVGNSGFLVGMLTRQPQTNPSAWLALACVAVLSAAGLALLVWRVREDVAG